MVTKRDLEAITQDSFARNAIRKIDEEWTVVGRFCRCVYNGDETWDVWLCNPDNLAQGLSERKVSAIYGRIADKCPDAGPFRRLTGEGIYPSMPTETFLLSASFLGIRRRSRARGNLPLSNLQTAKVA